METKKANFIPVSNEIGKSKRLSGLAIGLGVAGATGVGATAGVVLNNMLGKKHYDLDDDDDDTDAENNEDLNDENTREKSNTRHDDDNHNHPHEPRHTHVREPEDISDDTTDIPTDDIIGQPEDVPEVPELVPLGWYSEIDEDGNEVYFFLIGDEESGGAMIALAESIPGSGIYDTVIDLTTEPFTVEHIDEFYTREELETVIPNPEREYETEDDINYDDIVDDDGDDDDNDDDVDGDDDLIDNGDVIDNENDDVIVDDDVIIDGDDVIIDGDDVIIDDDDVVIDDDDVIIDDDDVIIDDDDVIIDDDDVIIDDDEEIVNEDDVIVNEDDVIINEDEIVIDGDNINVDEEVYGGPVEGLDPEIEDPYIEEDLYPDEDVLNEPMDDDIVM